MNIISDAQIKILAQSEAEQPTSYFYSPQIHRDSSGHYYVLYMLGGGGTTNDMWIAKSVTADPLGDWTHHQLLDPDEGNAGELIFVIDSDDNIHTMCAVYDEDAITRHYRHRIYDTDFTLLSSDTAFSIVFDDDTHLYNLSVHDICYDRINDIIHFIYRASDTASSETEGWKHRSYDFTSWSGAHELEETLSMSGSIPISLKAYGDHVVMLKTGPGTAHRLESFDSGVTWTDTELFDGEVYFCTNAAVDSDGNIHVCYEHEYGAYYMMYSASESTWSDAEQVISSFDDYQSFYITVDTDNTPYITVYIMSEEERFTEYRVYKKEEDSWTCKTGNVSGNTEEDWLWIVRPGTSYYDNQYQCLSLISGSDAFGIVYSPAVSYDIHNVRELQLMRDDLTGAYTIANDIDASDTSTWNGGDGFEPIGGFILGPFVGHFDGKGYTISGLFENRTFGPTGLFGMVQMISAIKNVYLEADITTDQALAGLLVGYSLVDIEIDNCHVSGSVVSSNSNVGGFIGQSDAGVIITNCTCEANIEGTDYVGGLVGFSTSNTALTESYHKGEIRGSTSIGGFCGTLGEPATISFCGHLGDIYGDYAHGFVPSCRDAVFEDCYSIGNIHDTVKGSGLCETATDSSFDRCFYIGKVSGIDAGGEVDNFMLSQETSTLSQCFSVGEVEGVKFMGNWITNAANTIDCFYRGDRVLSDLTSYNYGGFVRELDVGCSISNSYCVGLVPWVAVDPAWFYDDAGGFCGTFNPAATITACFYNEDEAGGYDDTGKGEPKDTSWIKSQTNLVAAGWDFATIWLIDTDYNDGYPCFQWFRDRVEAGNWYYLADLQKMRDAGLISSSKYNELERYYIYRDAPAPPESSGEHGSGSTAIPVYVSGIQLLDILD